MNKIKFFILTALFLLCSSIGYSQILQFKTVAFSSKYYDSYSGWSDWSDWEDSNMLLTINLNSDVITIYSPKVQIYSIYKSEGEFYDSDGDCHIVFKFIDQDYDKGTIKLLQRTTGSSEIYIEFANVKWAYIVRRI